MEQKSNKNIVEEFYKKIIGGRESLLLDTYIHDDYIQHSPYVEDGKAGLLKALAFLKTLPMTPANAPSPIVRMIAEDDLVMAHLHIKFNGKEIAVIDIFRMKNGKMTEHWSVEQEVPDVMAHGNGMF